MLFYFCVVVVNDDNNGGGDNGGGGDGDNDSDGGGDDHDYLFCLISGRECVLVRERNTRQSRQQFAALSPDRDRAGITKCRWFVDLVQLFVFCYSRF